MYISRLQTLRLLLSITEYTLDQYASNLISLLSHDDVTDLRILQMFHKYDPTLWFKEREEQQLRIDRACRTCMTRQSHPPSYASRWIKASPALSSCIARVPDELASLSHYPWLQSLHQTTLTCKHPSSSPALCSKGTASRRTSSSWVHRAKLGSSCMVFMLILAVYNEPLPGVLTLGLF